MSETEATKTSRWEDPDMLGKIQKIRRLNRFRQPDERVSANIRARDGGFVINFGNKELFLALLDDAAPTHEVFDFAGFALAALSMSQNIEIDLDFPISENMANQLDRIAKTYRLWSIDTLAPLRVNATNVVPQVAPPTKQSGVMCLSGGLDSLGGALEAIDEGNTSHALLVAGADYKSSDSPGFIELTDRVRRIASRLELDLIVAETNIRRVGFNWEMMHGFNLAFCLHFLSPRFGHGAFAQDNNALEDLFRMPWGNMNVLPQLFTTASFDIRTYGTELDRVGKMRRVAEFDEALLRDLSVCYTDKSTGGNCGRCAKCIQTRTIFLALGLKDTGLFVNTPNIAAAVSKFKVPKVVHGLRGRMVRTTELVDALPDGEVRDAYVAFENRLRRRLMWMTPPC